MELGPAHGHAGGWLAPFFLYRFLSAKRRNMNKLRKKKYIYVYKPNKFINHNRIRDANRKQSWPQ